MGNLKGGTTIGGYEGIHRGNNTTSNNIGPFVNIDFNTIFSNTQPSQASWATAKDGANAPIAATWGVVRNYRHSDASGLFGIQEFITWESATCRIFERKVYNGVWIGWAEVGGSGALIGDINYVQKITSAGVLGNSKIYDNGNIGIGTTNPRTVANYTNITLDGTAGSTVHMRYNGTDGAGLVFDASAFNIRNLHPTFPTVFSTATVEAMRILQNGNVGIGTNAPVAKLEIAGPLGGLIGRGASAIKMINTDTSNYASICGGIVGVTNSGMDFSVDGTRAMVIYGNGNLLVGTASDSGYKLRVNGTGYFDGYLTAAGATLNGNVSVFGTISSSSVIYATGGDSDKWNQAFSWGNPSGSYLPIAGGNMSGRIGRTSHSSGYFVGSYNSVGDNATKTNPIYTIGSSYMPSDTALGDMYGIGYSSSSFWGGGKPSGWGMYVTQAGGVSSVLGNGLWTNGSITATGNVVAQAPTYDSINVGSSVGTASFTAVGNVNLTADANKFYPLIQGYSTTTAGYANTTQFGYVRDVGPDNGYAAIKITGDGQLSTPKIWKFHPNGDFSAWNSINSGGNVNAAGMFYTTITEALRINNTSGYISAFNGDNSNRNGFIQFTNTSIEIRSEAGGKNVHTNVSGGNLIVGTYTDGGYKLRVTGTGYFDGNVTAPTFNGNLNGNASSANKLNGLGTTTNLNTWYDSGVIGWVPGATGIPLAGTYGTMFNFVSVGSTHNNVDNWLVQMSTDTGGNNFYYRTKTNAAAFTGWRTFLTDINYSSIISGAFLPIGGGTLTGARPITLSTTDGAISMRAPAGGWAMGTFIKNFAGSSAIAGFGVYGGNDSVSYHYIGDRYDIPLLRVDPTGDTIIKGNVTAVNGTFNLTKNTGFFQVTMPLVDNGTTPDAVIITTNGHNGGSTNQVAGAGVLMYGAKCGGMYVDGVGGTSTSSFGFQVSFPSNSTTNTAFMYQRGYGNIVFKVDDYGVISTAGGLYVGSTAGRTGNLATASAIAIGDSDTGWRQNGDGVLETYTNNAIIMSQTNATTLVYGVLRCNGDVVAYYSSDERLKDNIKPIEKPLEKISKLGGYSFDWNDKQTTYSGHDIGVIAQEVEEVLPELVITREDGYKAVKYEKLIALLIEGMNEQQKQINELKSQINGTT